MVMYYIGKSTVKWVTSYHNFFHFQMFSQSFFSCCYNFFRETALINIRYQWNKGWNGINLYNVFIPFRYNYQSVL